MARQTNTQFSVAVHLLTMLASEPRRARSSQEMALSVRASPVYMRRVLGRLAAAGTVTSRPGPDGGWKLTRDPDAVRLGEVWRSVNDDDRLIAMHAPNPDCPIGCRMLSALDDIEARAANVLTDELNRTSIADLAKSQKRVTRERAASPPAP